MFKSMVGISRKTGWSCVAFVAAWLAAAPAAFAAPGDLDPSFSQDGKQAVDLGGQIEDVEDVAVDAESRTLVAGSTGDAAQGIDDLAVARLGADGHPDPGWNGTGVFGLDLGASETASAVAPATGGGAYVAIRQMPTGGDLRVLRLGADGRPDPAFSGDGIAAAPFESAPATASDLVPTADGGVVVAGVAGTGDAEDIALARFGPDGSPNPALGGDGTVLSDLGAREGASAVALDGAGRIIVGGRSGLSQPLIARYLASGDLDAAFSGDGFDTVEGYAFDGFSELAVLADGRIATGGTGFSGSIFQMTSVMTLRTYSDSGEVAGAANSDVFLGGLSAQPDGGFALAYTFDRSGRGGRSPQNFVVDKLLASGEPDPDFGTGSRGGVTTDFERVDNKARVIATGPDGRIVVAGDFDADLAAPGNEIGVARYLSASGPRDPDADGVLGEADRCGRSYGPPPAEFGCEELVRPFTLTADPRRGPNKAFVLRGSLADACFDFVKVRLFRKEPGRDPRIGRDETNQNGDFSERGLRRAGRYYAEVETEFTDLGMCPEQRSPTVRVR